MRQSLDLARVALGLLSLFAGSGPIVAQTGAGSPSAPVSTGAEAPDGESPRTAILGYLLASRKGDDEEAARTLDLSALPESDRAEAGPTLARHLKVVLDQTLWFGGLDDVSDLPAGQADDGLPPDRDRVGTIQSRTGAVEVRLKRVAEPDGQMVWKFGPGLVERIPALYDEFGLGWIGDYLPRGAYGVRFLELELWQWVGLLVLAVLSYGAAYVATRVGHRLLILHARRTKTEVDDRIVGTAIPEIRILVALGILLLGTHELHLSIPARQATFGIARLFAIVVVTWLVLRLVDLLSMGLRERLEREGRREAVAIAVLGRRLAKFCVWILSLVVILQHTGFQVTGLIAGLGAGGLAAGLGAQKSVANLLGGLTLTMDRPVRVGDLCRFGDKLGTVEDVGLRSTRIRTLDRTVITVPNAEFSEVQIENFAMRDSIRLLATLSLRYETTPEQMRRALEGLRKLLREHEKVLADPLRVRFVAFGAYSLDVEVFAYIRTSDWSEFLGIREEIFLRMMEIVAESGAGFAFPSQTLYMARDAGSAGAR